MSLCFRKLFSSETVRNVKLKNRLWRRYKKQGFLPLLEIIRNKSNISMSKIKRDRRLYTRSIQDRLKEDPSPLWSYIGTMKNSSRIPGKMVHKSDHQEIVNGFASHFSQVFSCPDVSDSIVPATCTSCGLADCNSKNKIVVILRIVM